MLMRYNQIRECDIANGEGIGIALFVQGCHFHCKNCFNKDTWDFNGGKEWTSEVEDKFIELANRPYIKRISILGGEPLADENLDGVLNLINRFRLLMPNKTIWLYSGYTWKDIWEPVKVNKNGMCHFTYEQGKRQEIIKLCSVFVDGRYIDSQRDISKRWAGSSNQRVIDIKKTLEQNKVVLYCN
jgi:anaerobic ribonucleoside-triphosphate reductase activating protein